MGVIEFKDGREIPVIYDTYIDNTFSKLKIGSFFSTNDVFSNEYIQYITNSNLTLNGLYISGNNS